MLKIEKLLSQQALPLSKANNILNFVVPQIGTHLDFTSSYVQFEVDVTSATSSRIAFGRNKNSYYPVCMVRRSRLVSSKKGVLTEVNNLNILVQNLLWHNKTTSENNSDALWGWGGTEGADYFHTVFTDNSGNSFVKIPFGHLFPGSLANSNFLPTEELGELTIQLELEPTKNLFQQLTSSRWNDQQDYYSFDVACNNLGAQGDVLTVTSPGDENIFMVGDIVQVLYTDAEEPPVDYQVSAVVTEIGEGTVTVSGILPISTGIYITSTPKDANGDIYKASNKFIHCNPQVGTAALMTTLTVPARPDFSEQFNGSIQDITAGSLPLAVNVSWWAYTNEGYVLDDTPLELPQTLTGVVVNNDKTVTLTISPGLPSMANTKTYAGIQVQPLSTNLNDAVWTVNQAFCFPYRIMNGKKEDTEGLLLTRYTYEPLPFVSDGNSFAREILVAPNTTNCFLLMPPASDTSYLYSTLDGVKNYRFFLNDVALSNIPIVMNSSLDLDMKIRTFNNSEYPIRNINVVKNDPPLGSAVAFGSEVYCAKLKPHKLGGEVNYNPQDNERKPLRVEINGNGMPATKTIYFFKEEMKVV